LRSTEVKASPPTLLEMSTSQLAKSLSTTHKARALVLSRYLSGPSTFRSVARTDTPYLSLRARLFTRSGLRHHVGLRRATEGPGISSPLTGTNRVLRLRDQNRTAISSFCKADHEPRAPMHVAVSSNCCDHQGKVNRTTRSEAEIR